MTSATAQRTTHHHRLTNGITLLLTENPAADIIATRLFVRTGSCWEPRTQAGLCHLLAAIMTKGTGTRSSLEIAEQIESVGARLNADTATDYFVMSLKTVSADFQSILALAGQLLRSPSLPESELELERRVTLQAIRSQQEQPFSVAFDQLRKATYGEHPYGYSTLGVEETVAQLTRSDLEAFHQTYFRPDQLIISIAGRITLTEAIEQVEQVFGDWLPPQTPPVSPHLPPISFNPQTCIQPQETQQSIVMLGYLADSVESQDYAALKLINTYLGNGLSSRLFVELREKRGLAYDVSSFYPTRLDQSQFVVYMGTAPENTTIAVEGLQTETERLTQTQLTPEELQVAKNKLLGQYALGKQTNSQLAQIYGWYETLNLGLEFDQQFQTAIEQVTAEECLTVAQRYFTTPYLSLLGPETAVNGFVAQSASQK